MRRLAAMGLLAGVLSIGTAPSAAAQENDFLAEGATAPDVTVAGATRYGPVGDVQLSDLRGETVVLAFFFRARTRG